MEKHHVVIFPFLAKGHTIPLLHLSSALSRRGLRVTLITTPGNASFLRRCLPHDRHPNINLLLIPFPDLPNLPSGCESTDHLPSPDLYPSFLHATTLLRLPFQRLLLHLLRSSPSAPLCLISDFFLGWTLPICRRLRILRVVFHGMSAFSMALCKSLWNHLPNLSISENEPFHVPGTPPSLLLTRGDIPDKVLNSGDSLDPATQFIAEISDSDVNSWGVLVNSFSAIERDYVSLLESFYQNDARAWLVGPLCLLSHSSSAGESDDDCIRWLNERPPRSVVYVSFGTQAHVTDGQLDEVAYGLAESGVEFLWVVRSGTWAPPEAVLKRGRIVKWAPQREVLEHVATGGFVSHCGWNSVLEGLSAGVPILAWPMIAEQQLNAKHVVEELGAGLGVRMAGEEEGGECFVVGRTVVRERVRELMGDGERGRRVREKAEELGRRAKDAVAEGGSSSRRLDELIEELRKAQEEGGESISSSGDGEIWSGEIGMEGEMVAVEPVHWEFQDGIQIA